MWKELSNIKLLERYIAPMLIVFNSPKEYHYLTVHYKKDMFDFIDKEWNYNLVLAYLLQIANALLTMNNLGYLHLDVKPENILIEGKKALLCDFATVTRLQKGKTRKYIGLKLGTKEYASPEMLTQATVSNVSDVFSFTKTIHVCLFGKLPPSVEHLDVDKYDKWYDFFYSGLRLFPRERCSMSYLYKNLYYLSKK
tara:strand:+ start:5776 stop:6363 length:588 start_codon:yes stop_codon:yes gene_type:complete